MYKFVLILFFPIFLNADITVQSPLNNQYTVNDTIEFNFVSDQASGFYLFGSDLVPIRKNVKILRQSLKYGDNFFHLVFLTRI